MEITTISNKVFSFHFTLISTKADNNQVSNNEVDGAFGAKSRRRRLDFRGSGICDHERQRKRR